MGEAPYVSQAKLLWGANDFPVDPAEDLFLRGSRAGRVEADPENVERGLAQLVLTLIEFLRQLMERQALRRVESGSLSDHEVDRLGDTFRRLAERMEELKDTFELTDEDLNIHLGPLGDLL
jgi:hypothetical protein